MALSASANNTTLINANFDERVVIQPSQYQWVDSPMPGVERMMLDRVGGEVARLHSLLSSTRY